MTDDTTPNTPSTVYTLASGKTIKIPAGAEVKIGKHGAPYFIDKNGNRKYLNKQPKRPDRFRPKNGAFQRFLDNQS